MKPTCILPVLAAVMLLAACGGGKEAATSATQPATAARAQATTAVAAGPVEAAGVRVAAPSVDLGRVPLNTPVPHAWVLNNASAEPVALGQPRVQTLEGC